jgi:hypothetical protein
MSIARRLYWSAPAERREQRHERVRLSAIRCVGCWLTIRAAIRDVAHTAHRGATTGSVADLPATSERADGSGGI